MSDAQREGTEGKGTTRDTDAADGARPHAEPLGLEDVSFEHDEERAGAPPETNVSGAGLPPSDEAQLPPSPITIQVVGRTDVGLVREHNEDNYLYADLATGSRDSETFRELSPSGLLLGVCDGMGGAAAGEVASQMAVDTIFEMMRRSVPALDRDALARALVRSVEEAGTRIFEAARADRSRRGMGTTSTIAALMDKTLFVGQVGDSRAYILRGGELKQITKDQSLVNQLIEAGQLTEDEAEAFEHSNIILQALGTTEQVSVDLTFLELRRGDRLMMCSDGLSGLVHNEVIREVMGEYTDPAACCERLIELAKAGGGHDNVTVILCDFGGEGLALAQPGDLAGYQQYPLPLDGDPRGAGPIHSEIPTLAPPGGRSNADELAYGPGGRVRSRLGAWLRYFFLSGIVVACGVLLYLMRDTADGREPVGSDSVAISTPPSRIEEPTRVEVVVRSDIEAGELFVDGETFGKGDGGRWVLDLLPGAHKIDVRADSSAVATTLVTVRDGVPATVVLSAPEGELAEPSEPEAKTAKRGPGTSAEGAEASEGDSEREARRRRRRAAREAAEAEKQATPPSEATP